MARCGVCSGQYHQIPSDGPRPARIAVYAERPGQWEERNAKRGYTQYGDQKNLVGPTGREWNELYLPLAGLERDEVFVGNVVQCGAAGNRKPTAKEVQVCGRNHIPEELGEVQPSIVILMGATACSLIPEIDLEVQHGIPFQGRLYDWSGWILPMYHPALGLHEGRAMGLLLDDWEGVKGWLRGEGGKWPKNDLVRDYRLAKTPQEVDKYFQDHHTPCFIELIAADSESHGGVPFSVQVSIEVGSGVMVLEEDKPTIRRLGRVLFEKLRDGGEFIFHNAPADLQTFERHLSLFGVGRFEFRDTLQEAYHLGLPQGLKALSYRLLGRKRLSWEETVTPASKVALYEWMNMAIDYAAGSWTRTIERTGKRGQPLKPKVVVSKAESTLRSVLNHMLTSEGYDPWEKLEERFDRIADNPSIKYNPLTLESQIGRIPVKGVAHLSLDELVEYGCSDADDTLAVEIELERRRGEFEGRVGVREEDYDQTAFHVQGF